MSKKNSTFKSFSYAFDGLKEAILKEPNFRIHLVFALTALVLGLIFKVSKTEWIILAFTIAFVVILELVNTSLEAITDLVSPKIHPRAKVAKDVAAAAVFISAILAILIGAIIFLPKII